MGLGCLSNSKNCRSSNPKAASQERRTTVEICQASTASYGSAMRDPTLQTILLAGSPSACATKSCLGNNTMMIKQWHPLALDLCDGRVLCACVDDHLVLLLRDTQRRVHLQVKMLLQNQT